MEPVYRSDGEVVAVIHEGNLYNIDGAWIGVLLGAEVYGFGGEYIGYLNVERRLLRSRRNPDREPIAPPEKLPRHLRGMPEFFPMAPLFKQLPYSVIDVFEEYGEKFTFISSLRPDLD